ncbi:MAG: THxN family PEP-CTERM protein [Pseudomonadota bacterium]
MKKIFNKTLPIAALTFAMGYVVPAHAVPIFTFTEYGGFTADVGMAKYSGALAGDADLIPAVHPLYTTMSWAGNRTQQSSLQLHTQTGPTSLLADTWTTISTLQHNNNIISSSNSWFDQDIWGRFILSDADGASSEVVDSDSVISLNFTETKNAKKCAAPNPVGTACDDYFTITTPIDDIFFAANDGSQWMATFRFANLVNAAQIANVVYTGEGTTSSVDVQVLVTNTGAPLRVSNLAAIPEPATVVLFGLGLIGLYIANQRKEKTLIKVPVKTKSERQSPGK